MRSRSRRSARPAPPVPRMDGYVRVSRVGNRRGERFISPDVQREQISAWADARGIGLLRVFEELDESGMRANRPLLQEAIRRVEAGESDGLVVSKVSRFGRSLIAGLVAIERIHDAGGTFYAVDDGLDTGTDVGPDVDAARPYNAMRRPAPAARVR
jgi:site-specific DNA recombinase